MFDEVKIKTSSHFPFYIFTVVPATNGNMLLNGISSWIVFHQSNDSLQWPLICVILSQRQNIQRLIILNFNDDVCALDCVDCVSPTLNAISCYPENDRGAVWALAL